MFPIHVIIEEMFLLVVNCKDVNQKSKKIKEQRRKKVIVYFIGVDSDVFFYDYPRQVSDYIADSPLDFESKIFHYSFNFNEPKLAEYF